MACVSKWSKIRQVSVSKRDNSVITIPVFSVTELEWLGASYVVVEFRATLAHNYTLQKPINPPSNVNFVLAVRDGSLGSIRRFMLWDDVTEQMNWPLYNGEVLESDAVYEVWMVEDSDECSLSASYDLITSLLNARTDCCTPNIVSETVVEEQEIFAPIPGPLPLVFNEEQTHPVPPVGPPVVYGGDDFTPDLPCGESVQLWGYVLGSPFRTLRYPSSGIQFLNPNVYIEEVVPGLVGEWAQAILDAFNAAVPGAANVTLYWVWQPTATAWASPTYFDNGSFLAYTGAGWEIQVAYCEP